ncbi:MAG: bifunctional 3-demethylubiquinone-9 3-methyltransferase/2-octaprenyl-6-hydroxy phenol methylase [Myxococcaceae bacterium]|nr:bifunctional 3-demethylubiquinone-9 3-methyltransferase/2-octaprenyl-6-hydroxy phenol methylase [Myxococcaceae bacterium]
MANDPPHRGAERHAREESFHDAWARSADVSTLDVVKAAEACTSPELRHITRTMGLLAGKTVLDVGCGLGEASVYFAVKGATVTATDLSTGMLESTGRLAAQHRVQVALHHSAAEDLRLPADARFDFIYVGNLFHHVDVEATLRRLAPHLAPEGTLLSWDPLAYNPLINVYRAIATEVRTPDEHPLTMRDLAAFRRHFADVRCDYFWLTTLSIFVAMAVLQRRNPNRERYWKSVVDEADRWAPLYLPLERLDAALLRALPFLRPLCWNVVVAARHPLRPPAAERRP